MRKAAYLRELILPAIVVVAAALLQNTNIINVAAVKPNITLAVLVAMSFFVSRFSYYLILVFTGAILLKYESGFELSSLIFASVATAVYWLERKLPGRRFLNNLFLIGAATITFYLLSDLRFLSLYPVTILKEMIYNMILGSALFFINRRLIFYESGFGNKF